MSRINTQNIRILNSYSYEEFETNLSGIVGFILSQI
jgi:hypothetical protein